MEVVVANLVQLERQLIPVEEKKEVHVRNAASVTKVGQGLIALFLMGVIQLTGKRVAHSATLDSKDLSPHLS